MESVLCVVCGLVTFAGAIALSYLRSPQWHSDAWEESARGRTIAWWGSFQRKIRRINNLLLAGIGVAVFAGAFVPDGRMRMALWLFVVLAIFTTLFLAGLDAVASMVGYRQAVPETARHALTSSHPNPES